MEVERVVVGRMKPSARKIFTDLPAISKRGERALEEEYLGPSAEEGKDSRSRRPHQTDRSSPPSAPQRKDEPVQATLHLAFEPARFLRDSTTSHGADSFRSSPGYDPAGSTNPPPHRRDQDSPPRHPWTLAAQPQPTPASRIPAGTPRHPATTKGQMPSPIASRKSSLRISAYQL